MRNILIILTIVLIQFQYTHAQFSELNVRADGMIYLNKQEYSEGLNSKKRGYYVGPHILGDTLTMLLNKFENSYVYYEVSGGAYSTEEKNIIKPVIYKTIHKLDRYYTKKFNKGNISKRNAYIRLKSIVTKGIALKNYYTTNVEEQLKEIKNPEKLEEFLDSIVLTRSVKLSK